MLISDERRLVVCGVATAIDRYLKYLYILFLEIFIYNKYFSVFITVSLLFL